MKKNIRLYFIASTFFLLFALTFVACKSDKSANTTDTQIEIDKSFAPFYEKFHADETYQLEHINFPLQGLPLRTDSTGLANGNAYMQKEEWVYQSPLDKNSGFHSEYKVISPQFIEELVINEDRTVGLVRRFTKLGGEWYLTYYTKMGQVK